MTKSDDNPLYRTVISVEQLTLASPAPLVLDCRARLGDPSWAASAFEAGHLPGAQRLDLDRDLAAPPGDGGRHPLPAPETLATTLANLGAAMDQPIVLYDDAGGAFAARGWWCIRWLGHSAVAVLDGGLPAWEAAGESLECGPAAARDRGDFQQRNPLTQHIDAPQLEARLGSTDLWLVDARSEARFRGEEEPIDPVAGHIPGALCRPFQRNLDDRGHFRTPAALAEEFRDWPDNPVLYCGSGVTAAHNALAWVHACRGEPVLYPGSWSDWIRDPQHPVATA
ncbi:MAG: sulfurtransferase [Pseudomonadota bacterium]